MTTTSPMEAFFTRPRANEGIQLPLVTPDGRDSEHWVRVLGVDSDAFRRKDRDVRRRMLEATELKDAAERDALMQDLKLELVASLVVGWSFPEECTPEAVAEFMRQAPQVADAVDKIATRRSLFFASAPGSSAPTPSTSSVST